MEITAKYPKQLGIVGGGILTYSNKKLTFHVGSSYGPSPGDTEEINKFREMIAAAMARTPDVKFGTPLTEADEPIRPRRRLDDWRGLL